MTGDLTAGRALCLFLLAIASLNMAVLWAQTGSAEEPQAMLPVIDCAALSGSDLSPVGGAGSKVLSAEEKTLNNVRFCVVTSRLAPSITLQTLLPVESWSGRYLQTGCGGLCGNIAFNVGAAAGCAPLDTGGFVLAATDMGHTREEGDFGNDPQKRQDFAYRAQHLTAVASKALIQRYYGTAARKSYFNGCSDGGREALAEAQRYPDDFNGIIAGAPAMNFQAQNALHHAWLAVSNTGPDGRAIITADRLALIHQAVLEACDALDGDRDGLISMPHRCHFNPRALQCKHDPERPQASCLSRQEATAVAHFYRGPVDPATGEKLTIGGPLPGSELAWAGVFVPRMQGDPIFSTRAALSALRYLSFEQNPPAGFSLRDLAFSAATFDRLRPLHRLYDATNPDLSAFEQAGGKLIIWHGLADPHISPLNSIAYHQAVGRTLGETQRDSFERLYLLPGVYHCSGGEGPSLVDFLTPMMNWVEYGRAPGEIPAWRPAPREKNRFGQPQGGPPGKREAVRLRLQAIPPGAPSRPVYPYPQVAVYNGQGDKAQAGNYHPAAPDDLPARYPWRGEDFYQPYSPPATGGAGDQ